MQMNGCACGSVKFYLQKQVESQILVMGYSLLPLIYKSSGKRAICNNSKEISYLNSIGLNTWTSRGWDRWIDQTWLTHCTRTANVVGKGCLPLKENQKLSYEEGGGKHSVGKNDRVSLSSDTDIPLNFIFKDLDLCYLAKIENYASLPRKSYLMEKDECFPLRTRQGSF